METPICDFVRRYAESDFLRLHMPGHKGHSILGMEKYDITEIDGADSLYEADGIICESERNAGSLFECATFYSTEGSSLCIRAMLYLVSLYAKIEGKRPLIAAGRNAHKSFLSAAALLDLDIFWLYSKHSDSYMSCVLTAGGLDEALTKAKEKPVAVYITSPDYLGNVADIKSLSVVCRKHKVLLVVDNAHGAYLRFLPKSLHPIDLGADICCDSAHKTLPVLTGGAYMHIASSAPDFFCRQAKNALSLFGSTSPSYLILQSLDVANRYLANGYSKRLAEFITKVQALKKRLINYGFSLLGDEPLKLTVATKSYGYTGKQFAQDLLKRKLMCEFSDPDFVVIMLTPEIGDKGLELIERALLSVKRKDIITDKPPCILPAEQALSVREAMFSQSEKLPIKNCVGKILAESNVGCPPAVPIVVCGEEVTKEAVKCFEYYGIDTCSVVIE